MSKKAFEKVSTIIHFIETKGELTPKEAENITGKSTVTVRRYFKILVDTDYIIAVGNTNNILYRAR